MQCHAKDTTTSFGPLTTSDHMQSTPQTHFDRQRDSRVRSPPGTTGAWQHTPPSAGWLGRAALTAAGPAHHTGQRGEAAVDRTTYYCVSSTASTALHVCRREGRQPNCGPLHLLAIVRKTTTTTVGKWGRVDRSVATIQSKAISTPAIKLQEGHTTAGTPPAKRRNTCPVANTCHMGQSHSLALTTSHLQSVPQQ